MALDEAQDGVQQLLESPDLAVALDSDRFKQFLDQIPIAVAVAELHPVEKVVYANLEFERLSGQSHATVFSEGWRSLPGAAAQREAYSLGEAIVEGSDHLGLFNMPQSDAGVMVDAWSNIIEDEAGNPTFRLVALVANPARGASIVDDLEDQVREKDIQLQELQHRVKNNLQMITALIRIEARGISDRTTGEGFDRLAGRIEALGLLYRALGLSTAGSIDLGIYLSEIATAVMRAHALEGIHLDLQVDTWLVSLNVAMPAGLVVNELLTNALKHAFRGREHGVISLHCTTDASGGCRVMVSDNGLGLPEGYAWPKPGKLSALIVRSLLQNAAAQMDVKSSPGQGMRVEIVFRSPEPVTVN
jgi:two-component sensor histidine kinase